MSTRILFLAPTACDCFTLDGARSPGIARLTGGGNRAENWQNQQGPGFTGAFTVFRYEEISTVTYEIRLLTPEHCDDFDTWIAMLNAGKDQRPNPRVYTIVDPRIAHNGITMVSYADSSPIKQPTPGEARHVYEIKFTEVKRRKPTGGVAKPKNALEEKIRVLNGINAGLTKERDAALATARKDAARGR